MIQNSQEEFASKFLFSDKIGGWIYFYPILIFISMPLTAIILVQVKISSIFLGWFLSLSSVGIFLSLLVHSEWQIRENRKIFLIALVNGYMLEFTLVNLLEKYSYHNLPLQIFYIPILIPLGWVSAFYATSFTAKLSLRKLDISDKLPTTYFVIVGLGIIYGFFLEKLAASKELWDFHFSSLSIFSIPLLATLAWGLTLANFDLGMTLFQQKKYRTYVVVILVFILNLAIAWILLYFL